MRRFRVTTTSQPSDARTDPTTTRNPLPRAPRVGSLICFDEVIGRAMLNRGDGLRRPVEPWPVIVDIVAVAALQTAYLDAGPGVEGIVRQLLQHQTAQQPAGHAGPLLQAFHGAEQGPVMPDGL